MSEELVPMTIGWFDMPLEMREMVMKKMTTKTKGNLSSCSIDCLEEVRKSKNFITKLIFEWKSDSSVLRVHFNRYKIEIVFSVEKTDKIHKGECKLEYISPNREKKTCFEAGILGEIAINYFQRFLRFATHLEHISFVVKDFPANRISLKHLNNLKSINLKCYGENGFDLINEIFDIEKIFSIQNCVSLLPSILSFEQITMLKAKNIWLNCEEITSENLNQYLKLWKNGRIDRNVESVEFQNLKNLNYDSIKDGLEAIDSEDGYDYESFQLENVHETTFEVTIRQDSFSMKLYVPEEDSDEVSGSEFDWDNYQHEEYPEDPADYDYDTFIDNYYDNLGDGGGEYYDYDYYD